MDRKRVKSLPEPKPLMSLMYDLKVDKIIVNKDYQREIVWKSKSDRDELMRSIFLGYPIGVITLWENPDTNKSEIVDGLQRIHTIKSFVNGEDDYNRISTEVSAAIIEAYIDEIIMDSKLGDENAKVIMNNRSRGNTRILSYDRLPKSLKSSFDGYTINTNNIMNANMIDIRGFFRVLQIQEKLKAGEIVNSLLDNALLTRIKGFKGVSRSLKSIAFNNDRQDFQKYSVMYQGIFEGKLKIGIMDKAIVKYAESMKFNNEFQSRLDVLLNKLDDFDIENNNKSDRSFNKFSMKLLIGLYIFREEWAQKEDLKDIIQFLYKFSEFNSKHNSLNHKEKIPLEYVSLISGVSRISRTTHTREDLTAALDKLIQLYEMIDISEVRRSYNMIIRQQPSKDILGKIKIEIDSKKQ